MFKQITMAAVAVSALLGSVEAQTVTINMSGGWSMTSAPCTLVVVNQFVVSNPTGAGSIFGGANAQVGNNSAPNPFTLAGATVQGILNSGAAVTGGTTASATCTEFFAHSSTGSVSVDASVVNGPFVNNLMGTGFSGTARSSGVFGSSITPRISAGASSNAVTGTPPIIATLPAATSNSAVGVTNFFWGAAMNSLANGTLNNAGSGIQLNSNTVVNATISLF